MSLLTADQIQSTYARAMKQQSERAYEAALHTYGRILKANPNVAEVHFQIGRILCDTDKAPRAIRHLHKATTLRPKERAVWAALAEAVALGGTVEAEKEFLKALKDAPIDPATRVQLQDRFGARRRRSRPATGGMSGAQIQSLIALVEAKRPIEAEKLASQMLRKFPKSAIAHNILAAAQTLRGNLRAAEASLRAALRLDESYGEAWEHLGGVLLATDRKQDAMDCFRKAVSLCPGSISAVLTMAGLQIDSGAADSALPLLERLSAENETSPEVGRVLANALTRLRKYEPAELVAGRVVEMMGDAADASAIAFWATAKSKIGDDDKALEIFDAALLKDPDSPAAVSGKAQLLQTLGRFDEARDLFLHAFDIDPNNGENYRMFSASYKAKPGDPMIERMAQKFEDPTLSDNDRMNLGFGVSKLLEDAKDYDRVFKYLNVANGLMHKINPYDMAKRYHDVAALKEAYAAFDWKAASIPGTTDFAPIFVTGMPRSGTTLIEQIISSHSRVEGAGEVGEAAAAAHSLVMLRGKVRPIGSLKDEEFVALGTDFEKYIRERFPTAPQITDKSIQSYMALGLLKVAMPKAKFVVVRRDPRDNLLSIYKNKFPDETHAYAYDQLDLVKVYGTFVDMVDFWREHVPDWFYEVQYEDLIANPEEETRKLIAACGLEWEDACLSFHENKRKVQTLSVYQVRQPISKASVALWQRYEKDLKPMLDALREGGYVTD